MKIFSTQAREENTIKQSTKRTTSTMRKETCLCLRSEIGDRPSVFVPQGNRAKAQDKAEEHRTGDKGGRDQAKVRRWRENEIPCGEPIAHQKPHSTKHRTEDHARAFLEETPNGVSFIARTAQRGTK